jgi:hypothetical protein
VFPLVEWGWDRAECKRQIEAAGLPLPGKSACFMCPASKRAEIEELQVAHPELFAKVIHMEERFKARTIREKGKLLSTKGNGRNFDWASIACQPAQVDSGIAPCEEGFDFLGVEIELSVHDELLEAA